MKDEIAFVASSSRALRIPMVRYATAINRPDANEWPCGAFHWQYCPVRTKHLNLCPRPIIAVTSQSVASHW